LDKAIVEEVVNDELPTLEVKRRFMNFIEISLRVSDPFVNVLTLKSIFDFIVINKLFVLLKDIELYLWKVFMVKLRKNM